jgi:hypothetical protein
VIGQHLQSQNQSRYSDYNGDKYENV